MNELPADLKSLLKRGDPAKEVTAQTVARVAHRLSRAPTSSQPGLRPIALAFALLASAALGAAGTIVVVRLAPSVLSPARTSPAAKPPGDRTGLSSEAELLQGALEALNRHQTDRALALLDERDRTIGLGVLQAEANVVRVRVLLERREGDEALRLLEQLPDNDVTPALRVSWAGLLVERGACAAAGAVLAPVVEAHPDWAQAALAPCGVQGLPPSRLP